MFQVISMFPSAMRITLISVSTTACLSSKESVSHVFTWLVICFNRQISRRVFEILTVFPWLHQAYIPLKRLHKPYSLPRCSCFRSFPTGCKQSNVPTLFLPYGLSAHIRICRILPYQQAMNFSAYRSLLTAGCLDTVCGMPTTSLRG